MSIADKIETLLIPAPDADDLCIVSRGYFNGTVIDQLRPDGRTMIYGKTLEDVRETHADAEVMTLQAFCEWKASRQDSPVEWEETTAERFDDMLGCLPPALMAGGGFLVGEPCDHHALSGNPRFQAFRQRGDRFEVASRPMTRTEFRAEVTRG